MPARLLQFCFILLFSLTIACNNNDGEPCPDSATIFAQFVQPTGEEVIITSDGKAFLVEGDGCEFAVDYFDPNFRSDNYREENGNISIITPDGDVPILKSLTEDFESYDDFLDLFYLTFEDLSEKYWGGITLQSPAAKTVTEYVNLRQCIFDQTCDFIDNKIELTNDPEDVNNQCLKFTTVDKTDDMVVCKSSIQSTLFFFEKGDDLWFAADFFIEDNLPFSLVDFENDYFEQSPGPRVIISGNRLAIENKFGVKEIYRHDQEIFVPQQQWFNVKLHLQLDQNDTGLLELWQDGQLLFSIAGENLPLENSIQNSLEVGISASEIESTLFVDNIRVSDQPF